MYVRRYVLLIDTLSRAGGGLQFRWQKGRGAVTSLSTLDVLTWLVVHTAIFSQQVLNWISQIGWDIILTILESVSTNFNTFSFISLVFQSTTWSHARTLESPPTAPGKACSMGWATPSSSPVSQGTDWRDRRGWFASEAGGGCGAPLCQGVLVGGHMLNFFAFVTPSPF